MRILFAGDTHADPWSALELPHRAVRENCNVIVQCGDFAYTGRHREKFLEVLDGALYAVNRELWWVEGNHDDANLLKAEHRENMRAPARTSKHTMHLPRGYRWNWGGVNFLALGGAYSIDEMYRTPGRSWWPEETITPEDVDACGDEPVDVMITHDSPLDNPFAGLPLERLWKLNLKQDMKSRSNRMFVQQVVEAVKPKLLVHGHLHFRYTKDYVRKSDGGITRVEGLANEQTGDDQFFVLDTGEFTRS